MFANMVLNILLIVAIVLQSLTAVATANENHQIDVQHIQIKHDHTADHNESGKTIDAQGHEVNDCHHCGHCSGSHFSSILSKSISAFNDIATINHSPYYIIQSKEFSEAILRPPIA